MFVAGFRSPDTIFVLSYAIVLLNTDLHNANNAKRKSNCRFRRMRKEEFVRNLRGVDAGADLDEEMLNGIYDRIRANEFRPGSDHVTQVCRSTHSTCSERVKKENFHGESAENLLEKTLYTDTTKTFRHLQQYFLVCLIG